MQVKDFHGKRVIDSREVAEIVEKRHSDLLRDIRGYTEIMENSNERNFALVDFFIESSYLDSKGETRPCYLITKKGCDMIANKLTGEKGVLFTAAYVTAFEEMHKALTAPKLGGLPEGGLLERTGPPAFHHAPYHGGHGEFSDRDRACGKGAL